MNAEAQFELNGGQKAKNHLRTEGFDTGSTPFHAVVPNLRDNLSDTVRPATPHSTVIPWYEAMLDKSKFRSAVPDKV